MAVNFETVVGVVFAAIGGGILAWSIVNCIYAVLSRRWPQVTGVIVVSDLQRSSDADGGYSYRPEVSYRYFVNREEFVARRTRFGDRLQLSWSAPAVRIISRYRVGAVVSVHYNPDDPADAVLEPGLNDLLFAAATFGGIFATLGVLSL